MQVHNRDNENTVCFDCEKQSIRKPLQLDASNRPIVKSEPLGIGGQKIGGRFHFIQKIRAKASVLSIGNLGGFNHLLLCFMFKNHAHDIQPRASFFRAARTATFASRQVVLPARMLAKRLRAAAFHALSISRRGESSPSSPASDGLTFGRARQLGATRRWRFVLHERNWRAAEYHARGF